MICIVYPQFYGVGGIARYLESFLENLPEDSPKVLLITGDEHYKPRNYSGAEVLHVPFSSNRFNLLIWSIKVRRLLLKLYQQKKITCVNFHFPPLIPGLFLPSKIPIVLTAHTTYLGMSGRFYAERHYDSQWSAASLTIKKWMEHHILAKTKKVIALTEQGRQEVLSYGFRGPSAVIPNGADVRKFTPDSRVVKDIDVLFSGRIELRKGSRAMVKLCRSLIELRPNISIYIVGYGDDDDWVRNELAPFANNARLTGKVPFEEMIKYYNRSHIYASTSYYEGLPGTCLEAMAMGLPAVAWNFLFYKELIVDGKTGCLIKPNDFMSMSRTIAGLLDNPESAKKMGEQGRELLINRFNWRALSREIVEQFD